MDLISILATAVLAATVATVIMGFLAYGAFKLREKRGPRGRTTVGLTLESEGPVFFSRYVPGAAGMAAGDERLD